MSSVNLLTPIEEDNPLIRANYSNMRGLTLLREAMHIRLPNLFRTLTQHLPLTNLSLYYYKQYTHL